MGNKLKRFKEKHPEYSGVGVKDNINRLKRDLQKNTVVYTAKNVKNGLRFLGNEKQKTRQVWDKKRNFQCQVCGILPNEYGKYDYSKIDYSNPIIELEYFLSSPENRSKTSQTRPLEERQAYLNEHLSPEAVDYFWHPEDVDKWSKYDKSGTPYEPPSIPYYELTFDKGEVVGDAREQLGLKREGVIQRAKNKIKGD